MEKDIKKDIFNYLISIIIPGAINFFTVPILKWFLGSEKYGRYAIWYGAYLIVVAAVAGWLSMSIIRFKSQYSDEDFFYRHLLHIVSYLASGSSVISCLVVILISHSISFALLFSAAMFCHIFHVFIMAVSQANFMSRSIVYSEALRVVTFLCTYSILLWLGNAFYLEKIFFALILSYIISFFFLKTSNKISLKKIRGIQDETMQFSYRGFFAYGIPLVLWYFFSSILPYSDKITIASKYGFSVQGNYQAIFDLMYRTVTVLFAAVTMATFPYMSRYYSEGNGTKILSTIKRVILIEGGIMILAVLVYFLGGGRIFLKLLDVKGEQFYYVGALILPVAFIWQMAMMLQKPIELMKKTYLLLINNIIALLATLATLWFIVYNNFSFIAYPSGVLLGALTYAALCYYQVKKALSKGDFYK